MEYFLRFTRANAEAVTAALQRLSPAHEHESSPETFELRASGPLGGMADAIVQVQSEGVYFCDNDGSGTELLGVVIALLVHEFGAVTVAELE